MSTTTACDLLARADQRAQSLHGHREAITADEWRSFDLTMQRLLRQLVGPLRTIEAPAVAAHAELTRLLEDYPQSRVRSRRQDGTFAATETATPADAASPRPLDRLTITLGTLGDLVAIARDRDLASPRTGSTLDPMLDETQTRPVIAHVLAIAADAGRQAAADLPPGDSPAPQSLVRYAERGIALLGREPTTSALHELASHAPPHAPKGANEELEAALRAWAVAARAELRRTIPSTEALRNIANQAVHLYAASDALFAGSAPSRAARGEHVPVARDRLRSAAAQMRRLDPLWATVTTAARPGKEYVAAATRLYRTLNQLTSTPRPLPHALDRQQALDDLRYAAADVVDLMHTGQALPDILARSKVLFAPARILPATVERLRARQLGRWTTLTPHEIEPLRRQAATATRAADEARLTLTRLTAHSPRRDAVSTRLTARPAPRWTATQEPSREAPLPSLL